jgi:hypothetical protein
MDDVIIFAKTEEEHARKLDKVLKVLGEYGFKLNKSKCEFQQKELIYLGHKISAQGVATNPATVEAIEALLPPETTKQVRSFLGSAQYYRKFIPRLAEAAHPLYKLTKKDARFAWSDECQRAWEYVKRALVAAPVLAYPNMDKEFILQTDASDYAMGAVLLQLDQDGGRRPVAYASKTFGKAELNYTVTEKECLAIVWAVTIVFRPYLSFKSFTIETDHSALTYLKSAELTARAKRWALRLQEYTFTVTHIPGKDNTFADMLSRLPHNVLYVDKLGIGESSTLAAKPVVAQVKARMQPETGATLDEFDKLLVEHEVLESGEVTQAIPKWQGWRKLQEQDKALQAVHKDPKKASQFRLHEGVWCRLHEGSLQVLVPTQKVAEVLEKMHDHPLSGHLGYDKTLSRVAWRFWWPAMCKDIEAYCRSCKACQQVKGGLARRAGLLNPIPPAGKLERFMADIAGPFPETRGNLKWILTISESLTRWCTAVPMKDTMAKTIARHFKREIIDRFGVPREVLTDRGANFIAAFEQHLTPRFGIHHVKTTAYHPQSNGVSERFHRTLNNMLAIYIGEQRHTRWADYLPEVCLAYQSAVHSSLGISPFELMYGTKMRMPGDWSLPSMKQALDDPDQEAVYVYAKMRTMADKAVQELEKAQARIKKQTDKSRKEILYEAGDQVLVYRPQQAKRDGSEKEKLCAHWTGPVVVQQRIRPELYEVNHPEIPFWNERVHVSRLKRYHHRERRSPILGKASDLEGNVSPAVDMLPPDNEQEQDYYLVNPEMAPLPRPERPRQLPARYR